jgi:hypothetical protein
LPQPAHADFGNADPSRNSTGTLAACIYQCFAKLAARDSDPQFFGIIDHSSHECSGPLVHA